MPYYAFLLLCALACPIGMGVMMRLMMRGGGNHQMTSTAGTDTFRSSAAGPRQIDDGRDAQIAELRAQIEDLEGRNRALFGELETPQMSETPTTLPSGVREGELAR